MKAVELVCGSCGVRMRLKTALMERIWGHAGRVTCKACGTKIELDARSGELLVHAEGRLTEIVKAETFMSEDERGLPPVLASERTEFAQAELEGEVSPHFSQYPDRRASVAASNEPPVQQEPPAQQEASSMAVEELGPDSEMVSSRLPELQVSMAPALSDELKKKREQARNPALESEEIPSDARPPVMEAPVPQLADASDSLTPHTFDDEDPSEILRLPTDFESSPMSSNARDESFRSLFPGVGEVHSSGNESELARANRLRGPHPPTEGLVKPQALSSIRPLSEAEEKESRKSNWAPWALAAVATLGLIFNVMMGPRDRGLSGAIYGALGMGESEPPTSKKAASGSNELDPSPTEDKTLAESSASSPEESQAADEADDASSKGEAAPSAPKPLMPKPASSTVSPASKSQSRAGAPTTAVTPAGTSPSAPKPAEVTPDADEEQEPEEPELAPFSPAAAAQAIETAANQASQCRRAGDPSGLARITVTFASSGRVTRALVSGPPFAGTETGSCIAATFRRTQVAPFSGKRVTLRKTVTIR